jgi:hypothetical protein
VRRSFKEKDAAPSSAEMAARSRPRRSTLKRLVVAEVPLGTVRTLIERNHYSRSCPAVASRAFAIFLGKQLHGAAVFSNGSAHAGRLVVAGVPQHVVTLSRLWLSDRLPKNAESRVLGIILRMLRREGRHKVLLTFADPAVGHDGTIYRAAGFTYLGTTAPESYILIAGKECHPRSVASAHGSNDTGHLRRTGIDARRRWIPPKHRYVVLLDPSWGWRLRTSPVRFEEEEPNRKTMTG